MTAQIQAGEARPWTQPAEDVAAALGTGARGLSASEAARRRDAFGPNELTETQRHGALRTLGAQFANTMTVVLVAAAVVTAVVGDLSDTVVIGAIVVLNACIGFAQEHRAEQAMAALQAAAAPNALVRRDGRSVAVAAADLVPGDLVELAVGDVVAADLRLGEAHGLRVDEAALTGETEPVAKFSDVLPDADTVVADRRNMAFRGTAVTYGRGAGIVVATGMATEIGRIAALLQARGAGPTPLQRRLATLGRRIAAAALAIVAVVFAVGVGAGEPVEEMFLRAVSLAVAAIPEGLPAVVTIALALGARRMAERRALVRRLPAVEALGSVSVICTDKTGTLTENRMVVERVWTYAGEYTVSGAGYAPEGAVTATAGARAAGDDPDLPRLARVAALCTDARLHTPRGGDGDGNWTISGDPTEGALLALAGKLDCERTGEEAARPAARRSPSTPRAGA